MKNNVTSTLLTALVSPGCLSLRGMQLSSVHQGARESLYVELMFTKMAMNTVNFINRLDLRAVGSL